MSRSSPRAQKVRLENLGAAIIGFRLHVPESVGDGPEIAVGRPITVTGEWPQRVEERP